MISTRVDAPASAHTAAAAASAGAPPRPTRPPAPPTADGARAEGPRAVPGEHIVVFRDDVTREQQQALLASLAPQRVEQLPLVNGVLITTNPNRPPALGGLAPAQRAQVLYSQPNFIQELRGGEGEVTVDAGAATRPGASGQDPELGRQYHLDNTGQTGGVVDADVNAPEAWRSSRGEGVVIAVADTNMDIEHPDLRDNVWTNAGEIPGNGIDDDGNGYVDDVHGWNFARNSNRPQDGGQTHGTHVAGIIAATQGNGVGGAGVAPGATLMPLAMLGGGATTANAIKAFAYAVQNGANVISNSWGGNVYEPAMADVVKRTVAAGVSVVVASGNENWDTGVNGSYPDNYPGSLSVAASDHADGKASYSNRGTITIDVAAPGDKIYSTLPGGRYGSMSGTSMAAPVVSGLLALVKARYPQLTMQEVEQRVMRSVQRHGAAQVWNSLVATGGRVDAEAALTPIAAPSSPAPAAAAVAGRPVQLGWSADLTEGQRFDVEVSTNAGARTSVEEHFDGGTAARDFRTSGDQQWRITDAIARSGSHSFNVSGLGRGQQSRLELTETITEPTEISFAFTGGTGAELSFFINRDLQERPVTGTGWREFSTVLQPGTYTFTWLAAGKGGEQRTPVAIDELRIGSVSDAVWTPVGTTEPGRTQLDWTPEQAGSDVAVRVRADNGRFQSDWAQGDPFAVAPAGA